MVWSVNKACVMNSFPATPNPSQCPKAPCPSSLQIDWWEIPPYIYKDKGEVQGIFPKILTELVKHCCGVCVKLSYREIVSNDSEVVKNQIGKNGTLISLPIYGDMKDVTFQNFPFYPVVESPGVVFIVKKEDSSTAAKAVMDAVFQGWPVLVLTLIMAALSGIIVWALVSLFSSFQIAALFSVSAGSLLLNLDSRSSFIL